jgi:S-adenosylmethionine:tRNA ribosyltransferase-isomerase
LSPERRYFLSDFDYELPTELIAQRPPPRRGDSRLLVVRRRGVRAGPEPVPGGDLPGLPDFSDRRFEELERLIDPGDLVVLNTSRVRHARFLGTRPSGAEAEVLLIRPGIPGQWVALGRPGSALRPGKRVRIAPDAFIETVAVLEDGNRLVRFVGTTADDAMRRFGKLPLPPYITRDPDQSDEDRYQTVFADREGSVAAPTAGLHFTPQLLGTLRARGVRLGTLELEVGPGTFKPVESEVLSDHVMHPEHYSVPPELADAIATVRDAGHRVWAVGTTVVRALEAAAERGGRVRPGPGETRLFIVPGYRFKVVDRLITNFHLPRSTLLMLVSAFAGVETVRQAYRHAIAERYRFYSYGDAMAIV